MKRLLLCALCLPAAAWAAGNQAMLYDGYGSPTRFMIEGRVIESEQRSAARADDPWYENLWRNLRTLKNADREGAKLTLKIGQLEARATSDDEGYFRVMLQPDQPLPSGWQRVTVKDKGTQGAGQLLIVPPANRFGVISDIDDTVLISQVPDKKRLLGNTFLKNPIQRKTYPGTADFYRKLLAQNPDPQTAPMFYVSASPHQLAQNITACLLQNHFPRGVLVTKKINGKGHDPLLDQQQYKIAKIETLFAALPWVKFVLVGDDGERDPETYRALQEKYPQRVAAIYIRKVHPDPKRKSYAGQLDLATASAR